MSSVELAIEVDDGVLRVCLDEATDAQEESLRIAEKCQLSPEERQKVQAYLDQILYARSVASAGFNAPVRLSALQEARAAQAASPKAKVQARYVERLNGGQKRVLELYDQNYSSPPSQKHFIQISENRYRLAARPNPRGQKETCERLSKPKNASVATLTSMSSKNSSEYSLKEPSKLFAQTSTKATEAAGNTEKRKFAHSFESLEGFRSPTSQIDYKRGENSAKDVYNRDEKGGKMECFERLYKSAAERREKLEKLQEEHFARLSPPRRFATSNTATYDRQVELADLAAARLESQRKLGRLPRDIAGESIEEPSLPSAKDWRPTVPYAPRAYQRWESNEKLKPKKTQIEAQNNNHNQRKPFTVSKTFDLRGVEKPLVQSSVTEELKRKYEKRAQVCFPDSLARLCASPGRPAVQGVVLIKEKRAPRKVQKGAGAKEKTREMFVLI